MVSVYFSRHELPSCRLLPCRSMAIMWITQGCPDQGRDPYSHPNGLVIQTTGPKMPLVVHEAKLSTLFYMQPVNNWAWVVTSGALQWEALKVALTRGNIPSFLVIGNFNRRGRFCMSYTSGFRVSSYVSYRGCPLA